MALTLLEMAANVRQKKTELDATCAEMRHVGGDWTSHAIASEDATKIADDGLRNCFVMLDRLHQIALEDLAKMTPNGQSVEGRGASPASLSNVGLGFERIKMNDTEMLNWVQANMEKLHMDLNEQFTMEWINKSGIHCDTKGVNLRDCIHRAMTGMFEFTEA